MQIDMGRAWLTGSVENGGPQVYVNKNKADITLQPRFVSQVPVVFNRE